MLYALSNHILHRAVYIYSFLNHTLYNVPFSVLFFCKAHRISPLYELCLISRLACLLIWTTFDFFFLSWAKDKLTVQSLFSPFTLYNYCFLSVPTLSVYGYRWWLNSPRMTVGHTPFHRSLCWLTVCRLHDFRMMHLVCKAVSALGPRYIPPLYYEPFCAFGSSGPSLLSVPSV